MEFPIITSLPSVHVIIPLIIISNYWASGEIMIQQRHRSPSGRQAVESSWADGLRGIASLFVVSSHVTLCFARAVVPPSFGVDGPSMLFQRPFFRLIGQGNAWVAVFFVLLGYVNSLKTIRLSRTGSTAEALSTLASSSFRRTGRLVFPAAAVTVISWFFCEVGLYDLARKSDAFWLQTTTPAPHDSWLEGVVDLGKQLVSTWVYANNKYDQPQWALLHLFHGSMCIFMVLLATVTSTPVFRLCVEILLYIYSWASNDSKSTLRSPFMAFFLLTVLGAGIVLFNVSAGMILAELSFFPKPTKYTKWLTAVPYLAAILGLYLCSYPDQYAEQAQWSRQLQHLGLQIFPENALLGRFWPGLGAQILCFAIAHSESMRQALFSSIMLWLGGLSYTIYLLHGTLMRTIMTWLTFGPGAILSVSSADVNDVVAASKSVVPQPSAWTLVMAVLLFFAIMLLIANEWAERVEPLFATATNKFEKFSRTWGRTWGRRSSYCHDPKDPSGSFLPTSDVKC